MKHDGTLVALKLVDKRHVNAKTTTRLRREIKIMTECIHPSVAKLHHVDWNFMYRKKDGSTMPCVMLELELAQGGELFNLLLQTGCFPEMIARTYFQQLIQGSVKITYQYTCIFFTIFDELIFRY